MNACFANIIGLRGSATLTSRYGLYLNNLPILTTQFINDCLPGDFSTVDDFISAVIENSVSEVVAGTIDTMAVYFSSGTVIDNIIPGSYGNTIQYNTSYAGYRGIKVDVLNRPTSSQRDPFARVCVQSFRFLSNYTGNVPFRVRDSKGTIWSQTVAVQAGVVSEIQVNASTDSPNVYIEADNSGVATAKTKMGTCPGGCVCYSHNRMLSAYGWDGNKVIGEGYGIIPNIVYVCDSDQLACAMTTSDAWRQALLYTCAKNLLEFGTVTERKGASIMRQQEDKSEQRNIWSNRAKKHINIFVENSLQMMQSLQRQSSCITCNSIKRHG